MLAADPLPPPGWVELGAAPNRGLDLTGLRLAVQSIGNELFDGITTISPAVRYISFYTWTVLSYLNAKRPDSWAAFRTFAERIETAIAFGNVLCKTKVTGLVGTVGATRIAGEPTDPAPLNILVDQPAVNIYLNPSLQLKFTLPPRLEVPGLSKERGIPLARLIHDAISKTRLGALFSAGELIPHASREDLREFGQVAHLTNLTEQESDLLTDGIIPAAPTTAQESRRVGTYACILGLADVLSRTPTEDDLFKEAQRMKRSLPTEVHCHLNGWLRYSMRDAIAVGHEYVLQEVLQALLILSKGRSGIPSSDVIAYLMQNLDEHRAALSAFNLLRPGENPLALEFKELYRRIELSASADRITEGGLSRWNGSLTEIELIDLVRAHPPRVLALLPVIWCLAVVRTSLWPEPESNLIEGRRGLGWSAIGICEVIAPAIKKFIDEGWLLGHVMSELALRTVEQHLRVSWSRMAVDTRHDVALLTAEADRWQSRPEEKHVQDYRGGQSLSRLPQVVGWLQQLGLVDQSGLTPRGKKVYQRALAAPIAEANDATA
jgi:hypothetical protein